MQRGQFLPLHDFAVQANGYNWNCAKDSVIVCHRSLQNTALSSFDGARAAADRAWVTHTCLDWMKTLAIFAPGLVIMLHGVASKACPGPASTGTGQEWETSSTLRYCIVYLSFLPMYSVLWSCVNLSLPEGLAGVLPASIDESRQKCLAACRYLYFLSGPLEALFHLIRLKAHQVSGTNAVQMFAVEDCLRTIAQASYLELIVGAVSLGFQIRNHVSNSILWLNYASLLGVRLCRWAPPFFVLFSRWNTQKCIAA